MDKYCRKCGTKLDKEMTLCPKCKEPLKKVRYKTLYIIVTIIFALAYCVIKLLCFGWLSIIFFRPLLMYLGFYITSSLIFAFSAKNKTSTLLYWIACFLMLLFCSTWTDYGDIGGAYSLFSFIPVSTCESLCLISFVGSLIVMIILIILSIKNNKK